MYILTGIILVCLIIIYIIIKKKETFDYVFPRYREDVDWIDNYPDINFYIYNRSKPINYINLPNKGRDCHTILYHIINNYNNLGEVTIFGAYNSQDSRRFNKVKRTIDLVKKTNNTVFICESNRLDYDFTINDYRSTNIKNRENEEEKDKDMILSDIRPYGKWFKQKFPNSPVTWVCYACIFAVHRDHIIQHPLYYYEDLIKGLDNVNTELCHYMERAFTSVFWPYPKKCVY